MPSHTVRRYLVRFRRVWRDLFFRGAALLALALAAFIFSLMGYDAPYTQINKTKDYAEYYNRCKRPNSPGMRDPNPTVMLVPGLGMVLVPGLGVRALGSSRWIGFGQFRLQPSELMKLALALREGMAHVATLVFQTANRRKP